jgi:hypothetical protein
MIESKNACFACSWAVSTVMTRQNFVPSSDGRTMLNALIPMWDMCNHNNGKVSIRIFSVYSEFRVIHLLLRSYRRLVRYNNSLVFGVYLFCVCCVLLYYPVHGTQWQIWKYVFEFLARLLKVHIRLNNVQQWHILVMSNTEKLQIKFWSLYLMILELKCWFWKNLPTSRRNFF